MSFDEILQNILKAGAFLGGLAALVGVIISRRSGVKGDEREARKVELEQKRDTVADRDSLINQLQEDMKDTRDRLVIVEDKLVETTDLYYDERDYSRILLDWGYRGAPPPPPERPEPRRTRKN